MNKIVLCLTMAAFILPGVTAVTKNDSTAVKQQPAAAKEQPVKAAQAAPVAKDSLLTLTSEELATYNGKNGMPEYVAVDGVIYDVTGVEAWKSGSHKGGKAGSDITKKIKGDSPHKLSVLKKLKVVGKLVDKK